MTTPQQLLTALADASRRLEMQRFTAPNRPGRAQSGQPDFGALAAQLSERQEAKKVRPEAGAKVQAAHVREQNMEEFRRAAQLLSIEADIDEAERALKALAGTIPAAERTALRDRLEDIRKELEKEKAA